MKTLYNIFANWNITKKLMQKPFWNKVLSYEVLSYLVFGVLTTLVNYAVFYIFDKILGTAPLFSFHIFSKPFHVTFEDVSTFIAWVFAVLFAYFTNKLWVFESKSWKAGVVAKEILSFFAARIISYLVFEALGFMLLRNMLIWTGLGETACKWIAKITMSVLVVLFNYFASKFVVFRNKKKETKSENEDSIN